MQKISTVLFDAGNTLMYEVPWRWEIYAQVGREFSLGIDTAAMRETMFAVHAALPQRIGPHYRYTDGWFAVYIRQVFSHFGAHESQIPLIAEQLFARFRQPQTFRLFPETLATLETLRAKGVRMGIVSNWSPRLATIIRNLGIDSYFSCILSSSVEETEKPGPEIFLRALAKTQATPQTALHVGDSLEKDVQGAQGVGMIGVLIDRGFALRRVQDVPLISSLNELIPLMEQGVKQ